MQPTRPTVRTLREDLKLPLPSARKPLDVLDHPLLVKARELFSDDETGHERIRAIDDEILFKVKVQRWRGAVWTDKDLDLHLPLVPTPPAAGPSRQGAAQHHARPRHGCAPAAR